MVKINILLCSTLICSLLGAFADSVEDTKNEVTVTKYEYSPYQDGEYSFSYETSDGQKRSEKGSLSLTNEGVEFIVVTGSYSWIDSDGKEFSYNYIADENGYRTMVPDQPLFLPPNAVLSLIG